MSIRMTIRRSLVASFIAFSAVYSSPCRSQLRNSERSNAFCVGVLSEIMEYYNKHPNFFILPPFSNQVSEAMNRRLKALELTGLSHEHPWRSLQDQVMLLEVEDKGIKERQQCETHSYTCFSECIGALPSPLQSKNCRTKCEGHDQSCASSFSCIQ